MSFGVKCLWGENVIVAFRLTFVGANHLGLDIADLGHGGITALDQDLPGLVPALLPLLGVTFLPRQGNLNINADLLQLDTLHLGLALHSTHRHRNLLAGFSLCGHGHVLADRACLVLNLRQKELLLSKRIKISI